MERRTLLDGVEFSTDPVVLTVAVDRSELTS